MEGLVKEGGCKRTEVGVPAVVEEVGILLVERRDQQQLNTIFFFSI